MRAPANDKQRCGLCGRQVYADLITLHHLTPKQKGGKADVRTPLCRPCHKQLHATFTNAQLAKQCDTLAALRRTPELQKFLKWIRKQPPHRTVHTYATTTRRRMRGRSRRT